ncbi:hypothetical protein EF902_11520, partial [Streptomyces sp. WAC05858]
PGRPPGAKNKHRAPRYDVGKTVRSCPAHGLAAACFRHYWAAPGCRCRRITSLCPFAVCVRTVSGTRCTPRACWSRPSPRPRSTTKSY